jgi:hypothetical protein
MPAVGYTMMILEYSRTLLALLDPLYEGTMNFRNVGNYLPVDTASRLGIADSSAVPL